MESVQRKESLCHYADNHGDRINKMQSMKSMTLTDSRFTGVLLHSQQSKRKQKYEIFAPDIDITLVCGLLPSTSISFPHP